VRQDLVERSGLRKAIVMDRADRSLHSLLANTGVAGADAGTCLRVFFSVAHALQGLHQSHLVHTRLGTRQVLRVVTGSTGGLSAAAVASTAGGNDPRGPPVYRLGGMAARVQVGQPIVRRRGEPRVHDPPEVVKLLLSAFASSSSSSSSSSARPAAQPSQDAWALGCMLFQLATGRVMVHVSAAGMVEGCQQCARPPRDGCVVCVCGCECARACVRVCVCVCACVSV
jgi:hypothetical protein